MHARVYCFVILVEFWGESEAHVQTNTSGYIMCECLPSAVKHIDASGMYLRERERWRESERESEREGERKRRATLHPSSSPSLLHYMQPALSSYTYTTPIIQPLPPTCTRIHRTAGIHPPIQPLPPTLHLSSTLLHCIPPAPSTLYLSFVPYIPPTHTLTFLS